MPKLLLISLLASASIYSQEVIAPTPEPVGPPRGETIGDYNITNSFETGYRFLLGSGDLDKYRADVNYGSGIRLLSSSLTVDSLDGHGHYFDKILLNTLGLGNDPYQSASLQVEKNGLYRYNLLWRLNDYFNPGLAISAGLHFMNTTRTLQDHDLTLLPQSKVRVHLGFSSDTQSGPALSSVQQFDATGSAFPVFMNVRRHWNEYRLGAEGEWHGFRFNVLHRWDYFKDDSGYNGVASTAFTGFQPNPFVPTPPGLNQFSRSEPIHGSNPGWFGNLFTNHKYWGIDARITYDSGRNDFALNEAAAGLNFGAAANRQIMVSGDARRPVTAGDFNFNLYPTSNLTIANSTSVHSSRIQGDSAYTEFDNGFGSGATMDFRYLGVRTVANTTDINYRVTPWLGLFVSYGYSDRLIRTIEGFTLSGPFANTVYQRDNHLNSARAGVQVRPVKPLAIRLSGEIGRDNLPLTPISNRNYQTLDGRADYRTRRWHLSAAYSEIYNVNSPLSISAYSSHSRNYTADASWSPAGRFSFDASYMKLHLDTVSSLAFFAGETSLQFFQGFSQLYISNIHAANLAVHVTLSRRASLYAGYAIAKDVGGDPVQSLFSSVASFPLTYQSPLARLSIRITPKIRWNAGWQFYNYHEQFGLTVPLQNYRAHTGYSSVLWSF
ncbi:MAG TPA: hypothetical protein VKV17_18510 [Bryobacteraceae bacterium]|nr:hypothetical protein [Bryobacteraceae bacterium]